MAAVVPFEFFLPHGHIVHNIKSTHTECYVTTYMSSASMWFHFFKTDTLPIWPNNSKVNYMI